MPSDDDLFTLNMGTGNGKITGFTLTLEGKEDELKKIMDGIWKAMMEIARINDAERRRLHPDFNNGIIKYVSPMQYDGPTGELTAKREFP